MRKVFTTLTLATLALTLTACSTTNPTDVSNKQTTSTSTNTSIADAKVLGKTYIDAVCQPMLNDTTITQAHLDNLRKVAATLKAAPPVAENHDNDWLKLDVLSDALTSRADALVLNTPITAADKTKWKTNCDYIFSTYTESFKDF